MGKERKETNLDPEGGTLSDGGELSRLEVSPSESRKVLVLVGKLGETLDHNGKLGKDDVAGVAEENEVGIVGDVAGGGSEVNDGGGGRGVETENVDVSHNVVATLLLLDSSLLHLSLVKVLFRGGV
jgi:hypothetical protein